jgi:hypothetical protein
LSIACWKNSIAGCSAGISAKGGKVVYTVRSRISADGKTMTTTANGTNAAGKEVSGTNMYEKQ